MTADQYLLETGKLRTNSPLAWPKPKALVLTTQFSADDMKWSLDGAIPLPPDFSSNIPVVTYTVPQGKWLVINDFKNCWSGNGFRNGSGDIVWSILIGGGFLYSYGKVLFETPPDQSITRLVGQGGYIVYENQSVTVEVATSGTASATLSGGQIEVQMKGWLISAFGV
jgi:hypothetical protein